jgi:chitinase
VEIIAPQEGATFLVGQVIHVCASSQNFTDVVARVEFFAGSNSLGVVTNGLYLWNSMRLGDLREQSSCITWSNAAAGAYILTARATDLAGNTVNSAPVDICVVTNIPPLVHIT